jgi:3-phosphoshikimate 1-carboxyvinyltransferase
MSSRKVYPAKQIAGTIQVPGDKSISQRIAMLGSLAGGTTEVRGYLMGEDAMSTLNAMRDLGSSYEFDGDVLRITGVNGKLVASEKPLDLGNSGTGTRLLAGIMAGQPFDTTMIGDASLSSRPMGRVKTPLEMMGATLDVTGEKGTLPMTIHGGNLKPMSYTLPMASAQVKSCILLAGLFADGETEVIEPRPTRDHTERLFEAFGLPIEVDGLTVRTKKAMQFDGDRQTSFNVPGDVSSAAFWMVAASIFEGAEVRLTRVGLNPRRNAVMNVLKRMGADVTVENFMDEPEPYGDVVIRGGKLHGTVIEGEEIPNLIDEIPVLSVAAAFAEGETTIRDAEELRVKESDRLAVMVGHLRRFGISVVEKTDGMVVTGPTAKITAPTEALETHHDHRIAMSMAILALKSDGPVTIDGVDSIKTSYPTFWEHLETLGGKFD